MMYLYRTIEDNLLTFSETLFLLKKYDFELNYRKCQFLKKKIEYLGYIISAETMTISDRHVEAVKRYPIPKNIQELHRFLNFR